MLTSDLLFTNSWICWYITGRQLSFKQCTVW